MTEMALNLSIRHIVNIKFIVRNRFYKRNDPANAFDFHDIEKQERFLWYSASILTAPYGQVGERIKPGSTTITSSLPSYANCPDIYLSDDYEGNGTAH